MEVKSQEHLLAENLLDPANRELRRSKFSPLILALYRLLNCRRRWGIAKILLNVILRLEGPMRSFTARKIMWEFHGVEVGVHTYGDCFDPKIIPPNIHIGRYVSIASGVRMFVQNHPIERLGTHPYFYEGVPGDPSTVDIPPGHLEVGNDVWIGCNALILPGCHRIGDGAIIGAGAVVTKNVPDFAIMGGVPAKHLRDRFPSEIAESLKTSKWWLLPIEEVRSREKEFQKLLTLQESSLAATKP